MGECTARDLILQVQKRAFGLILHMHAQHLMWLPRIVLACATLGASNSSGDRSGASGPAGGGGGAELRLYPRYHLDNSSLLGRFGLPQVRWLEALCFAGCHGVGM